MEKLLAPRDDEAIVYTATTPLGCPHCNAPQAHNPPGIYYCGGCGKAFTVPTPQDLAQQAKKVDDDKRIFMMVGGVFFLLYGMPVLLSVGMGCAMMFFYMVVAIGVYAGSM